MLELFYVLVLSHLVADFYCQSDAFCAAKESKGFCAWQRLLRCVSQKRVLRGGFIFLKAS